MLPKAMSNSNKNLFSKANNYLWWRLARTPILRSCFWLFDHCLAFFWLLALLANKNRIRLLDVWVPQRIGHLAADFELFLFESNNLEVYKEQALKVYAPLFDCNIANKAILEVFKTKVPVKVYPQRFYPAYKILKSGKGIYGSISEVWIGSKHLHETINNAPRSLYLAYASKEKYQHDYVVPQEWRQQRINMFRDLGMPEGQKYVCIQARDHTYAPGDSAFSSIRNMDINCFEKACKYLKNRNVFPIRMGNPGMSKFSKYMPAFDYANSHYKSEEMDIALTSEAMFFVCSLSGIGNLAKIFSIPTVAVNLAPYVNQVYGSNGDLCIYKKLFIPSFGDQAYRLCSLEEFPHSSFNLFTVPEFSDNFGEYMIQDNTSQEILEVVAEMHSKLIGEWGEKIGDANRQARFKAIMDNANPSSKYCKTLIGSCYLERYFDKLCP